MIWLVPLYLIVGFALSIAWIARNPDHSGSNSITTFLGRALLWPLFLVESFEAGNRSDFWDLARKHPDIAYQWMLNDPGVSRQQKSDTSGV